MSDRERAAQILYLNDLGDRKPSAIMDQLLGLMGDRISEFLVRDVFLRSLPDKISIVVAASTSGLRDLALEADRHFATSGMLIATAQPTINNTDIASFDERQASIENDRESITCDIHHTASSIECKREGVTGTGGYRHTMVTLTPQVQHYIQFQCKANIRKLKRRRPS